MVARISSVFQTKRTPASSDASDPTAARLPAARGRIDAISAAQANEQAAASR